MTVSVDELEDALTVAEAAKALHVHRNTLDRIIGRKEIEIVRIGSGRGRIYITKRALTEYLNRRRERSA